MKVKELIQKLEQLDQDLEIICYTEDKELQGENTVFRLFDIQHVSTADAETTRLDDGTPTLKLGKSDISSSIVLLDVTAEF